MNASLALALALALATPAAGSQPASTPASAAQAASAPAIPMSRAIGILPGEDYPPDLQKAGVQGTVLVLVTTNAEGKPAEAAVRTTSRSPQLDAAALDYVHKYVKLGTAEHPAPAQVLVPIDYVKDSIRTIGAKTCADFDVDAAYFRTTFPDKKLRDMPVVNMSVGAVVLMQPMASPRMAAVARHSRAVEIDAVLAACTAHPDDLYFATLQHVIDDAIAKDR